MLTIPTAKVFEPLLQPARYLGAYGGRGGGKSHFFGELLVESGTLAICIREVQRTLAQSSKRLIETKIRDLGVALSSASSTTELKLLACGEEALPKLAGVLQQSPDGPARVKASRFLEPSS